MLRVGQGYALRTVEGDGTFSLQSTFATTGATTEIASGDYNGDGAADLLVAATSLVLYLGNGDGTFKVSTNLGAPGSSITAADINGDGNDDFAQIVGANIQIRLSNGDGTFNARNVSSPTAFAINFADLDGNGSPDIVVRETSAGDEIFTYMGNGNGTFNAGVNYLVAAGPRGATFGDIDGDGDIDVLVGRLGNIQVFENSGAGVLIDRGAIGGNGFLSSGDVNGDGKLDLAISGPGGALSVSLGNGNATFKAPSALTSDASGGTPRIADLDGDGLADIIRAYSGEVQIFLSNGNGTFRYDALHSLGAGGGDYALDDFTGDGVNDIAYAGGADSLVGIMSGGVTYGYLLPEFSLATQSDARAALDAMRGHLDTLASVLGRIGADQSRLLVALHVTASMRENSYAAAARITDADMADESSKAIRYDILSRMTAAVLAQANQQSSLVLSLLSVR